MSFDIFYHTCNPSTGRADRRNPFTGTIESMPVDAGQSAAERAAVLDLLRSAGASGPDKSGYFGLDLPDGGSAEVHGPGPEVLGPGSGWVVAVRSLTPGVAEILWGIGRAGNLAILPAMADSLVIVATEAQHERVRDRWPEAVVAGSAAELGRLLRGGFASWEAYRDRGCDQPD